MSSRESTIFGRICLALAVRQFYFENGILPVEILFPGNSDYRSRQNRVPLEEMILPRKTKQQLVASALVVHGVYINY